MFSFPLCQVGCYSLGRVFSYHKRKLGMFFTVYAVILDIVTSVIFGLYINKV